MDKLLLDMVLATLLFEKAFSVATLASKPKRRA